MWTIENLITSGSKALDTLMSQELLRGILYIINNVSDVQIKRESIQTLFIIIDKKCTQLSADEHKEVIKCIFNYLNKNGSDWHALQCLHRILTIENLQVVDVAAVLDTIMQNVVKIDSDEKIMDVSLHLLTTMFRNNIQYTIAFVEFLMLHKIMLSHVVNECVNIPKLFAISKSYLALVGIILSTENPVVKSYLHYDDILSNLKIPKIFVH